MTELSTLDILARLLVAGILSAAIGFEREARKKPAGMRTNALVGLGTASVAIASVMISANGGIVDPSRLVSSILPGIGFIGAGTIMRAGASVHGLTTAAGIWIVASIGIAAGLGMYDLAIVATMLALVALIVLPRLPEEETK